MRPPQSAQTQAVPGQRPQQQPSAKSAAPKKRQPRPKYCSEIPEVLSHLDYFNIPDDERYRRASKAIQHLSQPPSLPSFMTKSILNATTPQKDDASVLTMPNHTVLNHLATSSIRNGVLATSGTTRYKRKVRWTALHQGPLPWLTRVPVSNDDHVQTHDRRCSAGRLTVHNHNRWVGLY